MATMSLFLGMTSMGRGSPVAALVSVYAFAIYLIHNAILYVMRDDLYHEPTSGYFLLFSAVSFAAALGIALAVSRSRTLARVLFLIRGMERKEGYGCEKQG